MVTFAQLKDRPELLTPDIRSPLFHPDQTMTVIWEGAPETSEVLCLAEWMDHPVALEHIPGTKVWGGDFPAPPLPPTVCTRVEIGDRTRVLPSFRHVPDVFGPDLPATLPLTDPTSTLVDDVWLPATGFAERKRRVRIYQPHGRGVDAALDVLLVFDAQMAVDQSRWFPAMTDTLWQQQRLPPLLVVAVDHAGRDRPREYIAGEIYNHAARQWISETVLPYVDAHHAARAHWLLGTSLGASMALQVAAARPSLFAGGLFLSPWHQTGRAAVFDLVNHWPGGGRFFISSGTFGKGEQQHRVDTAELAERLSARGAQVAYVEREGYGHAFAAWERILPEGLSWLFTETEE